MKKTSKTEDTRKNLLAFCRHLDKEINTYCDTSSNGIHDYITREQFEYLVLVTHALKDLMEILENAGVKQYDSR